MYVCIDMLAALTRLQHYAKEANQVHFHLCGVRETRNRCTCESEANMCRLAFINRGGKIKLNISTIATQGNWGRTGVISGMRFCVCTHGVGVRPTGFRRGLGRGRAGPPIPSRDLRNNATER